MNKALIRNTYPIGNKNREGEARLESVYKLPETFRICNDDHSNLSLNDDSQFNIPPTNRFVVLTATESSHQIELDVEKAKTVIPSEFEHWFSLTAALEIDHVQNPDRYFSRYWTETENAGKAKERGESICHFHLMLTWVEVSPRHAYCFASSCGKIKTALHPNRPTNAALQ